VEATRHAKPTPDKASTGSLNPVGMVVGRMLGALAIYAVICGMIYVGWQYLTSPTPASSATAPAGAPLARVNDNANPQVPGAPVAHHRTHHPKNDASDDAGVEGGPSSSDSQAAPTAAAVDSNARSVAPPESRSVLTTDDLAPVRAVDSSAAEHIAAYCASAAAKAVERRDVIESRCRHSEVAAWHRLVANKEFPSATPAITQKCDQAPFPDSYVAKEACAKYELSK